MFSTICFMIIASLGQGGTEFFGEVPESATSFELDGSSGPYHAGLRSGKEWLSDVDGLAPTITVEVVHDTPWVFPQPRISTLARNVTEARRETSVRRKERLKQGWEDAGYVWVPSAQGEEMPVLERELEFARQAEKQEQALLDKLHAVDPAAAAQTESAQVEARPEGPGALRRWGGHIAVLAIAAALIGLVVKALILED